MGGRMNQLLQEKLNEITKKIAEDKYANEEVFLWNVIKQNPDINLLEYRICYAPSTSNSFDEYGTEVVEFGQKWWLEKI